MADWQTCFDWMMVNEDGPAPYRYKTVVDSNGGRVISGVNEKSFPVEFAQIEAIPQAERGPAVNGFYCNLLWNKWLEQLSNDAAKRIVDAEVNMGMGTAVRIAQLAAGARVDGHWGPDTVAAINKMDADDAFVPAFQAARLAHYRTIVQAKPENSQYLGTQDKPGPWWRRAVA